jgi:hypothetical protein
MTTRITYLSRIAYLAFALLFVAGILFQVFLVGLGLFAGQLTWSTHVGFGQWLGIAPFLLVILSFVGRLPRSEKWLAGSLFGVFLFQAEVFAAIRHLAPLLAALHPVLALVLFATGVLVAQRARARLREPLEINPGAIK